MADLKAGLRVVKAAGSGETGSDADEAGAPE